MVGWSFAASTTGKSLRAVRAVAFLRRNEMLNHVVSFGVTFHFLD